MTQVDVFSDGSGTLIGTPLTATSLDTAVLANTMLVSGGIPTLSGTLVLTQPAVSALYNPGGVPAVRLSAGSSGLTFTASRDTYVDLNTAGAYTLAAVPNNAAAPGVTANSIRLYKAVSGASAVTSVTQLAAAVPLDPTMISAADETPLNDPLTSASTLTNTVHRIYNSLQALSANPPQSAIPVDSTEAASNDTLAGGHLINNMNRLRYAASSVLQGSSWAAATASNKRAILADGTNAAYNLALPSGTTFGAAVPMLSNGGNSSSPTLSGTTSATYVNVNGTVTASPSLTGFNRHGGMPTFGAWSGTTVQSGNGSIMVTQPNLAYGTVGCDMGVTINVAVTISCFTPVFLGYVTMPVFFTTPFTSEILNGAITYFNGGFTVYGPAWLRIQSSFTSLSQGLITIQASFPYAVTNANQGSYYLPAIFAAS